MTTKNFVVKNGLTTGNINLYAGNSNIAANYVVANLVAPASANLGAVANVKITGGTAGYVLATNGAGTLSWVAQSGTPAGSATEIQYNGGGSFASSGSFTFDPTYNIGAGKLSVGYTSGGAIESDDIYANVTLHSLGNANIVGNVTSGNAVLGNLVTANYFSGDGGFLSNITVAAGSGIVNGNSNVQVTANSNVTISVNGTSNTVVFTKTGVNVAGNLSVSGNITSGSGTGGTISGANLVSANYISGNGSLLTAITGANVTGTVANATYSVSAGSATTATSATTAATVTTNAQPNITSVGTLASLNVTGNVTASYLIGNGSQLTGLPAGYANSDVANYLPTYTGNITGNIVTLTGNITAINANLGNLVTANYFTGTLTTGAQPNITSVGTLANLVIAGNITSGSGTGGTISGANLVSANYISGNGSLLTAITGANVTGTVANATYSVSAGSATTAATVTTNAQPNITSVGTLTDLTISGNLVVGGATEYTNVTNLYVKDPIIEQGGLANAGALTSNDGKDRGQLLHYYSGSAIDAFMGWDNSNAEFAFGSNVSVSSEVVTFNSLGNVRANYFLGNGSQLTGIIANSNYAAYAGVVTANAQPNITSVGTLSALTVTANISASNANLGNLVTANYFTGNGSLLTAITGANVTGTVANATYATSAGSATTAATVTTNAQPNITSVGTLSSVTVTANVTAGNVLTNNLLYANGVAWSFGSTYANSNVASYLPTYTGDITGNIVTLTGNITSINANLGNLVTANYFTGNGSLLTAITGANVTGTVANATYSVSAGSATTATSATTAATVTTNAQPNITSVGTLTTLTSGLITATSGGIKVGNIQDPSGTNTISLASGSVSMLGSLNVGTGGTGNVTATYFIGNGSQLTGLPATYANSNVASYLPTYTGNITGNIVTLIGNVTAINANLGNLVTANYFTGSGNLLSNIQASNISGQVANSLVAGTVYTNAQPNITSVGTLEGLTGTGVFNLTGASNVSLGSNAIVKITGGSASQYLQTDGAGNLTWASVSAGSGSSISNGTSNVNISTSNGNVQIVTNGNIVANVTGTGVNVAGTLNVTGIITATAGGIKVGNLQDTSGTNTITLSSGSVSILGGLTVGTGGSGNVTATNANLGNLVTSNYFAGTLTTNAQPNITSVGALSGLTTNGTINFTGASNVSLGANTNVHISGGTTGQVLSTDGAGALSWITPSGGSGGGASIANGTSNVNIAASGGNVTVSVAGTANVLTVTSTGINVTGNSNLGSNTNVLISGGVSGQVLATNGDGTLFWTTAGSSTVYQLDDITNYTDGQLNTFMLAYNQNIVAITDPYGILVTINGAVQPAFVWNTDVVWQNFVLSSQKGYTIINPGYLTFADPPPAGSEIMVRTVTGITNTVPRRYPFMAGDILLG